MTSQRDPIVDDELTTAHQSPAVVAAGFALGCLLQIIVFFVILAVGSASIALGTKTIAAGVVSASVPLVGLLHAVRSRAAEATSGFQAVLIIGAISWLFLSALATFYAWLLPRQ